ncbi:MAG: cache domain-containing protein [Firmicutes bacterium]|nr:cache domain-containing protein [Bacillota bacterium]
MAEVTMTVSNTQIKLAEFENISMRLFINKDFNQTLAAYIKCTNPGEKITYRKMIESCFNEYMISNQDIFAFMFICGPDSEQSIVIAKDYQQGLTTLARDFASQKAYQDIVRAGGGLVWCSPVNLDRSHFAFLGRYIKNMETGDPLGIVAIVIDEDRIDRLINLTLYNRPEVYLGEIENYSMVIDNDGEIVSTPFKEEIGKSIGTIMRDTRPLEKIFRPLSERDYGSEVNQGSYITTVNGKQTLVTYKTISSIIGVGGKSGWHLINLAPTSYLYTEVRTLGLLILVLSLVFGGLSVFLSFFVASLLHK